MAVIYNLAVLTVAHEELAGSPSEHYDVQGFRATRRLKCAWDDRHLLAKQLKGYVTYSGGNITIAKPHEFLEVSSAVVTSITIEPFGQVGGEPLLPSYTKYPHAILNVEYSTPEVQETGSIDSGDPDNAIVEESLEPYAEFMTIPGRSLFWFDGSSLEGSGSDPGIQVRGFQWVYTKRNMIYAPAATISLTNTVNASAVYSRTLGLNFPAETLLYNPPKLKRTSRNGSATGWDLEYRFTSRKDSWNKFFDVRTGTYEEVYVDKNRSTLKRIYGLGDFTSLVR